MSCGKQLPMNMLEENYDPNQPVCNNQSDFNTAFRNAVKYNNKETLKKDKVWVYVSIVLWLVFLVWGVLLAMRVDAGPARTMHLTLAIVFSPAYVLAHYLGAASKNGKMGFRGRMGMCGLQNQD